MILGHMWGEGQPLMGNVLNPDHLPHHAKDPKQLAGRTLVITSHTAYPTFLLWGQNGVKIRSNILTV